MPKLPLSRFTAVALLSLLCACSQGQGRLEVAAPPTPEQSAARQLPGLDSLDGLAPVGRKRISATSFELLGNLPAMASASGAAWSPDNLDLNASASAPNPAWAIFALPGFPTDGTIVPTSLEVAKNRPGWVALANYGTGAWEFTQLFANGTVAIPGGADYLSPTGVFYAALIAFPFGPNPSGQIHCSSLLLGSSGELPTGPTAVLDVLTPAPENTVPVEFKHDNSQPGDGAFSSFTYDFGDGSAGHSTPDLNETVSHTYENPGDYTVTLSVEADLGGSPLTAQAQHQISVAQVGAPTAALRVVGTRHAVKFPVRMDAALSDPGLGSYTAIIYEFGDGENHFAADPFEVVEHTYATPGVYTITLTVGNSLSLQDSDSTDATVADTVKEVLVVYNSSIPESDDLRAYYCIPETGRGIDPDYQLGIALGGDGNQILDRAEYNTNVREIIKTFLNSKGDAYKNALKYILLCKGVPHKINGTDGGDYNLSTYSAVDSELCTLYSDGTYPYTSFLWNGRIFYTYQDAFEAYDDSFFMGLNLEPLGRDYSFSHGLFKVADANNVQYPLDYLVGRLSGYTYDDAKALVDRAIAAESTSASAGWVIMDTTPSRMPLDTMSDPVWPATELDYDFDCGSEVLTIAGQNNFIDLTTTRIIGQASDGMPLGSVENVAAYVGWGVNHTGGSYPSGANYILKDLLFTYLPGAAWISYESYNGTTFTCSNPNDPTIDHPSQGQICDFVRMGGSCAIGNSWEPWTIAVGDERVVQYRYVVEGDRWIEAAYKGLRCLSWMEVVVGDPLCQLAP